MSRKKNDKLNIYCAEGDPEWGACVYIAAYTLKEAKEIALGTDIADDYINPYIQMPISLRRKAKYLKDIDLGKFAHELDIDEINKAGLTWWCCPECNGDDFEILDLYTYRCKDCNHEDKIPYRP